MIELARRRELDQATVIHHRDAIGQRHGLGLIVGDVDDGRAGALVKGGELVLHRGPEMHVEIGEWLVEQYQRGRGDQAARQGHALALAAGEVGRPTVS